MGFCSNCGAKIADEEAFCPVCGNKVVAVMVTAAAGEAVQQAPPAAARQAVSPAVRQTVPPRPPDPAPSPSPPQPPPLAYARGSEAARARGFEAAPARGFEAAPARGFEAAPTRGFEAAPARGFEAAQARSAGWYVASATGQTGGPYPEEEMRAMIARQQLRITDSVVAEGGTAWVPIMQSRFAPLMGAQARVERPPTPIPVPPPAPAPVACPHCTTPMLVTSRPPALATIFIIIGICFAGALVGIPFLIVGWHMRRNSEFRYQCPRCRYSRIELLRFSRRARE